VLTASIFGQRGVVRLDCDKLQLDTPAKLQEYLQDHMFITSRWSNESLYMGAYFPFLDEVILRLVFDDKPLAPHYTIAEHQLYGSIHPSGRGISLPTLGTQLMCLDQSATLDMVM